MEKNFLDLGILRNAKAISGQWKHAYGITKSVRTIYGSDAFFKLSHSLFQSSMICFICARTASFIFSLKYALFNAYFEYAKCVPSVFLTSSAVK